MSGCSFRDVEIGGLRLQQRSASFAKFLFNLSFNGDTQ